jgi:hypothetical protein
MAGHDRERLNWAEGLPTTVALGRVGFSAKAFKASLVVPPYSTGSFWTARPSDGAAALGTIKPIRCRLAIVERRAKYAKCVVCRRSRYRRQ